ncbi:MAG TPA: glycoside hydrolase family 3 N-terminal domain-containing protein [Puia sp.]|nr:glycoside hydrolase family 3 N-terminal domain-containing protein [Puia sp.]
MVKLVLTAATVFTCTQWAFSQPPLPKYLDPNAPIEERINDLLPRLTLEEKIIQLSDSWGSKGIPRLRIPAMLKTEGLHGQSYSTGATIYPQPIEMASTFNTYLIGQVGKATAIEAKAANLRVSWSPVLDVARDIRWGRVEETYGEDPYLVSRMGVAWIRGFQGEHMIAVPKHFAGHGEPLGGRDSHDVGLSDRVMREIHLPPFRAAVKEAHTGGVMAAYSTWNGVPDNGSVELLQKILREEWGFDGFVVSDCSGPENFLRKQSVVTDLEEAGSLAILAGVDIECGSCYVKALASAIQKGLLSETALDANLRPVFRAKFRLGLFENPGPDKMVWEKLPAYDTPERRALAREVAVEGSVLLKNDNKLLPLRKDIGAIAVIGPNADMAQTGDYSASPAPGQLVTVLQGIRSHVSSGVRVLYAKGCGVQSPDSSGFSDAVKIAGQSDVVVLVVGDYSTREYAKSGSKEKATSGENVDGATLEIPGVQRQLIRRIQATGKPVVLVLVNGKPFTLPWEAEHIPAMLETWYPGEEGGNATADLLFGDRNPSGRLPVSFPRHVGQLPLHYDYEPSGRNYDYYDMPFTPLYRFGHGLSYTSFQYSHLKALPRQGNPGFVTVSADIENTGDRDGEEVAQLYITDMLSSVITPVIQLEGVQRVSLKKGEKKTVVFELTPYQLSLLNANMTRVLEAGLFRVHVGGVSPEPPAGSTDHKGKIGFKNPAQGVSGEFAVPGSYQAKFSTELIAPATVKGGENFQAAVTVKNQGNLVDIAEVKLYGDTLLDTWRFEIEPGETKTHVFTTALYNSGGQHLTAIVGEKRTEASITVYKAPAKLSLTNIRTTTGDDGVLHYSALAQNAGSEPFQGKVRIEVDDKVVTETPVELQPGEQHTVQMEYAFPHSGAFRVKAGDAPAQEWVVAGGVSLALRDPLVYLDFDETSAAGARNKINGVLLPAEGKPQYVPGRKGKAFLSDNKETFIPTGKLDLYRKPFTLAAWVNIADLDNGQAGFWGGQAPMGADVDNTGTNLFAGVSNDRLLLSFQDRDARGNTAVPTGSWLHIAYTYDPAKEEGILYLNGKPDKSSPQKPYTGQLDRIGSAPRFNHGKFAMDDILVTRSCLGPDAIRELADKGPAALQEGEIVTEWRTAPGTITTLKSWATIPANSGIRVIVESGDSEGNPIDSRTVELRSGMQAQAIAGLKPGAQVRLHIRLTTKDWNAFPQLGSVFLSGEDGKSLRWSTNGEWRKTTFPGSVKIGE